MTYSPINVAAYTAAFSGAIAGMGVSGWITDQTSSDYEDVTLIAGAFAQAFDQVWNNATQLNNLEQAAITAAVQTDFNGRGPGPFNNPTFQDPSNWTKAAGACAALILESDIFFTNEGINPGIPGVLNYGPSNEGKQLVIEPSGYVGVSAGTFPIITSAVGVSDGDIVRLQGLTPGVYVKAQADSSLDSAGIVGVKWGTFVIPFSENPIVNFDSPPVVGQPSYLSATVAGKLTSIVPGSGAISVPIGLIVQNNTSVGTAYSAQVAISSSIVSQLSLKEQFISDAATTLGVVPSTLHSELYDYNTLPTTGLPTIGNSIVLISPAATHLSTTPPHSRISFVGNNGGGGYAGITTSLATPADPTSLNILQNTSIANQLWSFRIKFRQTTLNNTLKFWLDKGAGNETIGLGMVNVGGVNSFYAIYGNFNPLLADPTVGQRTLLGPEDTIDHILTMSSVQNGTIIFKFDSLPSLIIPLAATASPTAPELTIVSTVMEIDYWMICAP